MLKRLPKMDSRPKDENAAITATIFTISVSILIVIVQMLFSLFPFNSEELDTFLSKGYGLVICIATSGLLFFIIRYTVGRIYTIYWIHVHKDLYIAGEWRHVHRRNKGCDYLRAGTIYINQNFYNLEVHAENFNPVLKNGKVAKRDNQLTRWRYLLGSVADSGEITGLYQASNRFAETNRLVRGVHRLFVLGYDENGYPSIIGGEFTDCAPSSSEGYIMLYRINIDFDKKKSKPAKSDGPNDGHENDLSSPEAAWKDEIRSMIEGEAKVD